MEKQKRPTIRARRSYHHGDLRAAALEEALRHINRDRDISFTLRELAAALGVSSTALYRHFENKLALLAAVAEEGYRELLRRFDSDESSQHDPLSLMASRGRSYVQFAVDFPAHFRVMFLPQLRQPGEFPALRDLRQQVYGRLEQALSTLKQQGLLSGADLRDIALTSWATVHGLASLLVDGQVRVEAGHAAKDIPALIGRVLTVQAEGFLADGVRLAPQPRVSRGPGSKSRGRGS
jgi:AcrR family transcriptional regulator